jgi:peptide deformylase
LTKTCARLIDDMLETMYDAPGIGLAASQVTFIAASSSWTSRKTAMTRTLS